MLKDHVIDGGKLGEIMVNVCGWYLMRLVGKLLHNKRLCVYLVEIQGRCKEISI